MNNVSMAENADQAIGHVTLYNLSHSWSEEDITFLEDSINTHYFQ